MDTQWTSWMPEARTPFNPNVQAEQSKIIEPELDQNKVEFESMLVQASSIVPPIVPVILPAQQELATAQTGSNPAALVNTPQVSAEHAQSLEKKSPSTQIETDSLAKYLDEVSSEAPESGERGVQVAESREESWAASEQNDSRSLPSRERGATLWVTEPVMRQWGVQAGGFKNSVEILAHANPQLSQVPVAEAQALSLGGLSLSFRGTASTPQTPLSLQMVEALGQEGFVEELGAHISMVVGKKLSEVNIMLQPEKLGKVHLRLLQNGKNISLNVMAEDQSVARQLTTSLPALREVFTPHGLNLTQVNIHVENEFTQSAGRQGRGSDEPPMHGSHAGPESANPESSEPIPPALEHSAANLNQGSSSFVYIA